VGTRRRVRKQTFGSVLRIDSGWPPACARAATFRPSGPKLAALTATGHPFFRPRWLADIVGMVLDAGEAGGVGWPAGRLTTSRRASPS
jgi:hypothetical protein